MSKFVEVNNSPGLVIAVDESLGYAWLKEDKEEGWPRQRCKLLSVSENTWGLSYIVQVEPDVEGDDGIREVTADQLELT